MPKTKKKTIFGADFEIFVLGIVSFLTDVSSEMIFSVLSIFLIKPGKEKLLRLPRW